MAQSLHCFLISWVDVPDNVLKGATLVRNMEKTLLKQFGKINYGLL